MKKHVMKSFIIILMSLIVSACSTIQTQPEDTQAVIVEDRAVVDGRALPLPSQAVIATETMDGNSQQTSVVKNLLNKAQRARDNENWDVAANSLERALRIEPRNAMLWGQLAEVRFRQTSWYQSIQLAAKSNALAGDRISLIRQNWYLMANAHEALGEIDKAKEYRQKLYEN